MVVAALDGSAAVAFGQLLEDFGGDEFRAEKWRGGGVGSHSRRWSAIAVKLVEAFAIAIVE